MARRYGRYGHLTEPEVAPDHDQPSDSRPTTKAMPCEVALQHGGSLIPSPYTVVHIRRVISADKDIDTGNNVIVELPPIVRKAQAISQIGRLRGSSKEVFTPEFVRRIETDLHLVVANPNEYAPQDQVLLFPEVDADGDYVPGTGFAFVVDGLPYEGLTSPWPTYTKAFGGMVRLRRVT